MRQLTRLQMLAPGDDMRPRNGTQRGGLTQPGEIYKPLHVDLACALCFLVGDVAEPFDLRGNFGEFAELRRS